MDNYMNIALKEAYKAYKKGEVPVGAVIVKNGKVISKAHNMKEIKKDCTNHAEILAIRKASRKLKNWRLLDCELYVTMEPCMMCSGAIAESRINKIFYGVENQNFGMTKHIKNVKIVGKVCEEECQQLLKKFFKNRRTNL